MHEKCFLSGFVKYAFFNHLKHRWENIFAIYKTFFFFFKRLTISVFADSRLIEKHLEMMTLIFK